jgi:hypothetical protein
VLISCAISITFQQWSAWIVDCYHLKNDGSWLLRLSKDYLFTPKGCKLLNAPLNKEWLSLSHPNVLTAQLSK